MPEAQTHVIVGAGLAGAKTAEALREHGFDGRIVLSAPSRSCRTSARRCRRTTCVASRRVRRRASFPTSSTPRTTSTCARAPPSSGSTRTRPSSRAATASATTACCSPPAQSRGASRYLAPSSTAIHYLRDFDDADAIAARLERGGHVVVIGAGWIGSEVAASARQKGLEVTIVERADVPLEQVARPRGRSDLRAGSPGPGRRAADRRDAGGVRGIGARRARQARGRPHGRCGLRRRRHRRHPSHEARRARRNRRRQRDRHRTRGSRQASRACSPPATSRTPSTRSTGATCGWSTGPTP